MATVHPLQAVPGLPESALSDADAARIPAASPPAPWPMVVDAVVWWHRAAAGAAGHLPAELRGRRALPVTVGALIRYRETPVGPYREVLGAPVVLAEWPLPCAVVPFIAVDSAASVHGGRANWQLPKALARFDWPEALGGRFALTAEGAGWSVGATVSTRPRRVPVAIAVRNRQVAAGGEELTFDSRVRGAARLASVEIDSRGATLPHWLLAGRHPALVLERARFRVGHARWAWTTTRPC